MSRSKPESAKESRKSMLLRRVGHELGRELATTSLFFHTLVAGKVGLNAPIHVASIFWLVRVMLL